MSFLNPDITYYDQSNCDSFPDTPLGFLRALNGLTVIDLQGNDTSRTRVVTTLIHGNEPSGLIACHLWLKSKAIPSTNLRIILCNPEAAKTKPFFTNRYIAHSQDLNRYFSQPDSNQTAVAIRARQIADLVRQVKPEAIIDLHNTSGASPAFSVSVSEHWANLKLAELFASRLIYTQIKVGAIMEQDFGAPIVTIECGGANENASHQVAANGLHLFFTLVNLFETQTTQVAVMRNPIRVVLIGDASVGFSEHRLATTDITLRADIETLNHSITPTAEFIGWCNADSPLAFQAVDISGKDQSSKLFENRNGCLFTKQPMQLFMVTTIPEIATKDCLFYTTIAA